jgi:DNA-directed RNA polymerase specialized sigma24 family protein
MGVAFAHVRGVSRDSGTQPALLGMAGWRITLTINGDEASFTSFTSFMERVARPLRQALIAAYGPDVGPEVTAEALAYAWEHWDRIGEMSNPAGYLYRVAQSHARRGIFRRPPSLDPSRLAIHSPWFEPGLGPAIASLSQKQRAAVVLVHGYGWTITEVAEMWGVTFSTVSAHIDRGMARLRRKLGVTS